jgi:hypothetical protein
MKPVDLYVGPDVKHSIDRLVTAFELAHGVRIKKTSLSTPLDPKIPLSELNSSVLFLMSIGQKPLLKQTESSWTETVVPTNLTTAVEQKEQLVLIHFPENQADPNVIEVVKYLSATNQAYYLYSGKIE